MTPAWLTVFGTRPGGQGSATLGERLGGCPPPVASLPGAFPSFLLLRASAFVCPALLRTHLLSRNVYTEGLHAGPEVFYLTNRSFFRSSDRLPIDWTCQLHLIPGPNIPHYFPPGHLSRWWDSPGSCRHLTFLPLAQILCEPVITSR